MPPPTSRHHKGARAPPACCPENPRTTSIQPPSRPSHPPDHARPRAPPPPHTHTQEKLPPPPPAPPLEAPWKPPPPGFDARTLRRQASTLRAEAAAAHRDEEAVRGGSLRLAEVLRGTVENGKENTSLARERLRCLHAALRRLRGERAGHARAVEAAVAWQESLEELRCEKRGVGTERVG